MNSNSKEPVRTGNKIKRGEAFDKTPSRATAPAGGCKQRPGDYPIQDFLVELEGYLGLQTTGQ